MDVKRAGELVDQGETYQNLARRVASPGLVRIRHGAYAETLAGSAVQRHVQLIEGTWPTLGPDAVLSHVSAGLVHGLPAWAALLSKVTTIRSISGHGERRTHLHARRAALSSDEIVELEGYRVTSIERTAIDLACLLSYERAVAVLDAALHATADASLLAATVEAARRRHGIARVRAALAFADGRAESPGESISRVRVAEVGIARPELQVNIFDEFGRWVARSDFGWLDRGVIGEFDSRVKYLGSREEVARAVMKEKAREAAIRRLGWSVVRWGWDDLADRTAFRDRIEAEFARASNPIRGRVEAA
jgi:hypothetical protein